MTTRYDKRYETDTTPSRAVVERYRKALPDNDSDASLALVHYRGTRKEFDLGMKYTKNADPLDRATGADVLGQLGWSDQTFLNESVAILIPMLDDPDPGVVFSAAVALGHRADSRAIPALVKLAKHPNADIRRGVVHGLLGHDHQDAIRTMIQLSKDPDHDVRNWATFGIGAQIDADTPEIREALAANLHDPDHEIRGEAIIGLAERRDSRVVNTLIEEWLALPFTRN